MRDTTERSAITAPVLNMLQLDATIARINARKDEWVRLPIPQKIDYLDDLFQKTITHAEKWVDISIQAKHLPADSPLVGEEWMGGPWAFLHNVKGLRRTLQSLQDGTFPPFKPNKVRTRPDGQVVVEVFPITIWDKLTLGGFHAEVWMEPDITRENLRENMATFYQQKNPSGISSVLLAAGNLSSIAPMDLLYRLFALGNVCIMKMNPVNDYLGEIFERVFEKFIEAGYVNFVYGGAEVGEYLVRHPEIDEIHMTGSEKTHDAILYGTDMDAPTRKANNDPLLHKPFTCELGGACPVIIVPGDWDDTDIQFHAEHIVTQRYHNAGYNCVAAQVMVTPAEWNRTPDLVAAVERVLGSVEYRYPYYPGTKKRQQAAVDYHGDHAHLLDDPEKVPVPRTFITDIDPTDENAYIFRNEMFGGVLGQTSLAGSTPLEFLRNAVKFCNENLMGTLGANILIHPKTIKALGSELENCLADLKYGAIAINAWTGSNYLFSQVTWGAYPGHTHNHIESGRGIVHNNMLFEKPQKSVVYGFFYPFPRSYMKGEFHTSPKPGWFVTNSREAEVARRFFYFEAKPSLGQLPGLFSSAMKG